LGIKISQIYKFLFIKCDIEQKNNTFGEKKEALEA